MAVHALAPDSLVLAISTDDSWLYVGTVTEVIDHGGRHRTTGHALGDAPRDDPRALDFYDAAGHQLQPLLDETPEAHGFATADGQASPVEVRHRIDRVLASASAHLAAHPPSSSTHYPVGTVVPEVGGELPEVLAQLHRLEHPPANAHSRGWFHNLLHAMG